VFSQDGRIVRKLTEDAGLIEQELVAEVEGTIAPNGLARLCRGLVLEGQADAARARELAERKAPALRLKGIAPEWCPGCASRWA
jgi:23S rRNA pseudouridine2604 synthase